MRAMTDFRFATRAVLAGLLFGVVAKTSAAQYEVEGQIEQTIYNMDGSTHSQTKSWFTVHVNDCSWLIQETNVDADGQTLRLIETASTNGGLIYSVAVPINQRSAAVGPFGGGSTTLMQANIYSNNVPVGVTDGDDISHLWMMFASGCHLKSPSTNLLTPVYDLNASACVNRSLKRWAKWDLISGPGSLPTNVTFFESGPESPVHATYVATGVTNAGDLKIPSGFTFEQRTAILFAPGPTYPGDPSPAYHIRKRAVATVIAVRPRCSLNTFMPQTTGRTYMIDMRLASVPNSDPRMNYVFPDGVRWVSVAETKKLIAAVAAATVSGARFSPQKPPPKKMVAVILLAPAVFVFCLWLLSRGKRQIPPVLSNSESGNPPNGGDIPPPNP